MQISTLERHSLIFYLATKKNIDKKKIKLHQILIGLRDHCKQ
jgi:hypothetical protein